MKTFAALAGASLLATQAAYGQPVSGSGVSITGGAVPAVTSSSTVQGTTSSTSTTDPTIIVRPRTRATARGGTGQAVGNQVQIVQGGGGSSGGTAGDPYVGTTTQNYSGGYTQTLRNVPELVAPSVNGGANGCAVGVSGGVAVAGFGITTGAGWSDPDCERRQLAALTYNMNEHELASEILCDSKEVRAARLRMGKPCIADIAKAGAQMATETQRVDPAILRRQQDTLASQQPVAAPGPTISASAVAPRRPDWCDTSSPKELSTHHECD